MHLIPALIYGWLGEQVPLLRHDRPSPHPRGTTFPAPTAIKAPIHHCRTAWPCVLVHGAVEVPGVSVHAQARRGQRVAYHAIQTSCLAAHGPPASLHTALHRSLPHEPSVTHATRDAGEGGVCRATGMSSAHLGAWEAQSRSSQDGFHICFATFAYLEGKANKSITYS